MVICVLLIESNPSSSTGEVPLEIFLLEKLSHPNIMPLYTFHKLPQHWVFTMDYSVDTVDLRQFTRTQGRLAEVTARLVNGSRLSKQFHVL